VLIVVVGARSMLAADLIAAARRAGHRVIPLARPRFDILADRQRLEGDLARAIQEGPLPPTRSREAGEGTAVVNCAAYTRVDDAEREPEAAYALNGTAPGELAGACAALGLPLLQISTDYVFSGLEEDGSPRSRPYTEADRPNPLGVYGKSKLAGEQAVLAASPNHLVVRTAWLFGRGGPNFVETMLRLAGERGEVAVVEDQVGCPTWTGHLAPALVGLLERQVRGLVHLAGGGATSWCSFAKEIFRQQEVACKVRPITTAQAGRPAPRPPYSVLESSRGDVIPLPPWQDGLAGYLAARSGIIRP